MAATITEKKQRRAAILDELQTYAKAAKLSERPFTDDERKKIDALKEENERLKSDIGTAERDAQSLSWIGDLEKELGEVSPRQSQPDSLGRTDDQGRVTSYIEDTDEVVNVRFGNDGGQVRHDYKLQKRLDWQQLRSKGYKPCGNGGQFGSFAEFVRTGFDSPSKLEAKLARQYEMLGIPTGMNESAGAEGGYFVMPEYAAGIIDRVYANDLWSRTDNYTVTGNNMTFNVNAEINRGNGNRHGGLRGYWLDGEASSITSTKPTFREVSMKLKKLGVLVYLTNELIDDGGAALQQYVARKAAEEFNFLIGDSLINGTGVGQPLGVLNAPSLVSIAKETGQAAATIIPENIVKMDAAFYGANNGNAVWLRNQDTGPQLHLMTLGLGTSGVVVYMPPGGLSSAPYGTLMGRPVMETEFNPTIGTQGDVIKADLRQMLSISKGGIMQTASVHVAFLTDQLAIRFIMRLDARPWESAPLTPYKGTQTQSNFVVLDTRA